MVSEYIDNMLLAIRRGEKDIGNQLRRLVYRLLNRIDDYKIGQKLKILYIGCVLLPMMKLLSSVSSQGSSVETMKNALTTSAVTPTSVRAAATILTMLPIVCLYPFLQRYFIVGLTIGGVKE